MKIQIKPEVKNPKFEQIKCQIQSEAGIPESERIQRAKNQKTRTNQIMYAEADSTINHKS